MSIPTNVGVYNKLSQVLKGVRQYESVKSNLQLTIMVQSSLHNLLSNHLKDNGLGNDRYLSLPRTLSLKCPVTKYKVLCSKLETKELQWIMEEKKRARSI
jgi:hypothetical protein